MKFWDEAEVDRCIRDNDREGLGVHLAALARYTVATHVRTPDWMDRSDLVQIGVLYCLQAVAKNCPAMPRMPYFVQVIKWETIRAVRKGCQNVGTSDEREDGKDDQDLDELVSTLLRTRAAGQFPEVVDELVRQYESGATVTARAFLLSQFGRANRDQVKVFFSLLKEELG